MRIFILNQDVERYRWVTCVQESSWEALRRLDGRPASATWSPISVSIIKSRSRRPPPLGDFPHLASHIPVLSERAATHIRPAVSSCAELLPLHCPGFRLNILNVTVLIDALDHERSDIEYFKSGKVMSIERYALRREALSHPPLLFRLSELPLQDVFATETFVELVKSHDLRGATFEPCALEPGAA